MRGERSGLLRWERARVAERVARRVRKGSEEEEGEKSYGKTTHEILRTCDISHI